MTNIKRASSKREQARARRKQQQAAPYILMGLGGLVILFALVFFLSQPGGQSLQPVRVGAQLGDFSLTDISGQRVRLSDYEGNVVLINAWATWCPPCRAEMPDLNAYFKEHQADGFVVLAVNAGDTQSDAAAFAQDYGLAFPVLLDPQVQLLNSLNIHSFPTSIIVGRDGIVKDIHIGMFRPEQIEAKVTPLLSQ